MGEIKDRLIYAAFSEHNRAPLRKKCESGDIYIVDLISSREVMVGRTQPFNDEDNRLPKDYISFPIRFPGIELLTDDGKDLNGLCIKTANFSFAMVKAINTMVFNSIIKGQDDPDIQIVCTENTRTSSSDNIFTPVVVKRRKTKLSCFLPESSRSCFSSRQSKLSSFKNTANTFELKEALRSKENFIRLAFNICDNLSKTAAICDAYGLGMYSCSGDTIDILGNFLNSECFGFSVPREFLIGEDPFCHNLCGQKIPLLLCNILESFFYNYSDVAEERLNFDPIRERFIENYDSVFKDQLSVFLGLPEGVIQSGDEKPLYKLYRQLFNVKDETLQCRHSQNDTIDISKDSETKFIIDQYTKAIDLLSEENIDQAYSTETELYWLLRDGSGIEENESELTFYAKSCAFKALRLIVCKRFLDASNLFRVTYQSTLKNKSLTLKNLSSHFHKFVLYSFGRLDTHESTRIYTGMFCYIDYDLKNDNFCICSNNGKEIKKSINSKDTIKFIEDDSNNLIPSDSFCKDLIFVINIVFKK